jgi:hypothetical protein
MIWNNAKWFTLWWLLTGITVSAARSVGRIFENPYLIDGEIEGIRFVVGIFDPLFLLGGVAAVLAAPRAAGTADTSEPKPTSEDAVSRRKRFSLPCDFGDRIIAGFIWGCICGSAAFLVMVVALFTIDLDGEEIHRPAGVVFWAGAAFGYLTKRAPPFAR